MNLQPLGDRVIVKPLSEEDSKTPSGIYIPDTAKEKPQEGEVVATESISEICKFALFKDE